MDKFEAKRLHICKKLNNGELYFCSNRLNLLTIVVAVFAMMDGRLK